MKIKTFILTFLLMSCPFLFGQTNWWNTNLDGTESEDYTAIVAKFTQTNTIVGAFVDNELRGKGTTDDNGLIFLNVNASKGAKISFKLYDGTKELNYFAPLVITGDRMGSAGAPIFVKANMVAIGEETYASLTEALAAAQAGQTLTFLADITENATVNKNVTIDGAGKIYTGQMKLTNRITTTIKNVNFDGADKTVDEIYVLDNKGNKLSMNNIYAIETRGASYVTIENCTAKKYFGFVQLASATDKTTVKNVKVTEMGYGVKVDYSNAVVLENVDITAGTAAVLNSNYGEKTITIKNSDLNILGTWTRNNTTKTTYVFEGANSIDSFITDAAIDNFKLATGATLTAPNDITATATEAGYSVKYADGKYFVKANMVAIGEETYASLTEALAAAQAGQTLTFLADITENATVNKNVTIDGAGKIYTGQMKLTNRITTTIKNVNFDGADKTVDEIYVLDNKGNKLSMNNIYAIETRGASYVTIENCTAKKYFGFVQLASATDKTTVKNVKVTEMGYGVKVDYSNAVVLENVDITAGTAAVLNSNYGEKTITIKNSDLNILGTWTRNNTTKTTYVFEGANSIDSFITDAAIDNFKLATGATLTAPNDITATAKEDGYIVKYEDGKYIVVRGLKGSGTEDDPFVIMTIEDLIFFRDEVNEIASSKYNAPGVYVALGADIDMAGVNWVGIGSATADHGFMGNFDGKNFKIKNLTITDPTLDSDGYAYAGLFAVTEGTDKDNQNTIKNLTIENVTITTTGHIVSAAIAYPYYTIVDNVKVCGNIKIKGGDYTSGVLAYTRRCVNASDLSIDGNEGSYITGRNTVGGVISDIQMNGGLTADYNNFSAEGLTITGTKSVGGISGIIATQTLDGATVKNVTLNCSDARVGVVSGSMGAVSTISNVVAENVTGATAVIGATYDNAKAIEARIVDTYYATFNNAYTAAENGNTITVLNPVVITENNKSYDLTGINVVGDVYPMFRIQNGATVTFDGGNFTNGDYIFTLGEGATESATSGNLVINGGKYHGETTVANVVKGLLTINGGEFSISEDTEYNYAYVINCYDATYRSDDANVAIQGGTFHKFNPENNLAEGLNTNFCAQGYICEQDGNIYKVVRGLKGSGTEDDPFVIMTIEDLIFFRDEVNEIASSKYNAPGVYVALGADIDMAGVNWVGIGSATADHGFMGNFDGKNFKIKNLTITDPTLDSDGYAYAGLFAVTEGTDKDNQNTIKNLTIENVTITTTGHIVSAAIAYPYYTIVDNVKVCGNIKIKGGDYTSGVLAYTRRCVNASDLSIDGNEGSYITGRNTVGGVISDIQMNGGLTADYNNFSAEGLTITGTKSVGGISGIIATQTLDGATVKNVTLNCSDARVGVVSGSMGAVSTISNVVAENVTGATAVIGATYDNAKAIEARIVDTYYATFNNAYTAAENGNTITVLNPVVITENNKSYDLTGINVVGDVYPMFRIQNGATVTFDGGNFTNGDYIFTLGEGATESATSGNLVINGGKYHGETTVANVVKGLLTINGGEFSISEDTEYNYAYVINCYDATYRNDDANVAIQGGTFHNFDPENNAAEGNATNFCAEGYLSVGRANNIWTVERATTQELALLNGWNWVSHNVIANEANDGEILAQMQKQLETTGEIIKTQGQNTFVRNTEGVWAGGLRTTSVEKLYKVKTTAAGPVNLTGAVVEDYNIELVNGWNWIGYPLTTGQNLTGAFTPNNGDWIKGRNAFAEYYDGTWYGLLKSLEPGQGYMYYHSQENSTELTYNTPSTRGAVEANITTDNNYWTVEASEYASNMSMVATLGADSENYELAAFVNGEVRGSARPIYVEAVDAYMFFLTINGDDVEEVTFKYYDIDTDTEYTLGERINYSSDAILGSIKEPVVLRGTLGMDEVSAYEVAIYPNPTTTANEINLSTTCDNVEVFNALGVKVAEYQNVDTIDALETAGVYVIRVTNNGNTQNCRLVVK